MTRVRGTAPTEWEADLFEETRLLQDTCFPLGADVSLPLLRREMLLHEQLRAASPVKKLTS